MRKEGSHLSRYVGVVHRQGMPVYTLNLHCDKALMYYVCFLHAGKRRDVDILVSGRRPCMSTG
jgi:hypothetical protein